MPTGAAALPWRAAASIILVSRSTRRVLLLRRGKTAAFMPGALVFPGGVVNDGETGAEAAFRELFEETGVLALSSGFRYSSTETQVARWQNAVNEKGVSRNKFKEILGPSHLSFDKLIPWSTWLTPNARHYRRRYMTDFFVLPVDDEPEIRHCDREMAGSEWCDPAKLLADAYSAKASVPPPQQYELSRLNEVADYGKLKQHRIRAVLFPQLLVTEEEQKDRQLLCNILPGDQLYVKEPPGQFDQGTKTVPYEQLANPDRSKPLHRLTYLADPIYTQCKIDISGVNPLKIGETLRKDVLDSGSI